jgi:hypothetical protein
MSQHKTRRFDMSFLLYMIGFILVIGGIAWALVLAGIATIYIVITCLILLGIAVLTGVTRTRLKDPQ